MIKKTTPTLLMILDGYGLNPSAYGNAIATAKKPNIDKLFSTYPNTSIGASGMDVGLPDGQMGNSEVGHLNIGAGRIVYQDLTRITNEIEKGDFYKNKILIKAMDYAVENNSALHIMGLLSDGGVHSHIDHLFALLKFAKQKSVEKIFIHLFLDGRDVPPRSAEKYIKQLEDYISNNEIAQIATISGRYYAMDRDNRWERVEKAYDAITLNIGEVADSPLSALKKAYGRGENDEFVLPSIVNPNSELNNNDSVIMFNFRPDRAREITRALVDESFDGFQRKKTLKNLLYTCMTQYDVTMPNVSIAYPPQLLDNTLGEYIASLGLKQLRIAETEKYAHVTFFFNGGVEAPNKDEDRILIPSPKVATYDLQPEMSAFKITDKALQIISENNYDLIILNFANPDMVGHTGKMDAAVKAIETVDKCVIKVISEVTKRNGQVILTSDHGNADVMLDEDGNPLTAHSVNRVPLLIIANKTVTIRNDGILADVSPTILDLMGLDKPLEMTGSSLIITVKHL